MLIVKDYILTGYHPMIGELDLSDPGNVRMDGTVECIDASIIVLPDEAGNIRFGTPVTLTIEIHGGDDE